MQNLFEGFKGVTLDQWKEQIEKDLKGTTFEQLSRKDDNGLTIYPVYTGENSKHRGAPVFVNSDWMINSFVDLCDDKSANQLALHDLNYGAQALTFVVNEKYEPEVLLNNISIEHIQLNFVFAGEAKLFSEKFFAYLNKRAIDPRSLYGTIIADPVNAVIRGLQDKVEEKWNEWKQLVSLYEKSGFTVFVTDGFPYHNAGASASTELACLLAHLNEQLNFISENRIDPTGKDFFIGCSASVNFFETVSKFRALRKLATFLLEQYGMTNRIFIHASNSLINKTVRDNWNNLIRSTVEGMGAVCGGADSLLLFPYDFVAGGKDKNGRRWALDQQLIFKEESLLNAVADTAAGSYFIDEYTHELCERGWEKFKDLEKRGGLIPLSTSGELKKMISEEATQLKKQYISSAKILIGVNKFRNEKDKPAVRTFLPPENKNGLGFFIAEQIIEAENLKTANA